MNESKTAQIKQAVAKIDLDKIANYPEHPQSQTLRRIISYSKRIIDSNNEEEIFRLAVRIAYGLEMIVNKVSYVKDEQEKKYWLAISDELFKNTIGKKE